MNHNKLVHDLIEMLRTLDLLIEILANSTKAYRKMAFKSNNQRTREMLAWVYNIESIRHHRLLTRKRSILRRHSELMGTSAYEPRIKNGPSKMGRCNTVLGAAGPLDILDYAIENEDWALRFFRRKATAATETVQRIMCAAVVKEQEDQIAFLKAKRQELIDRWNNRETEHLKRVIFTIGESCAIEV